MDFQKTDLEEIQEHIRKDKELAKSKEINSVADTIANHLRRQFKIPENHKKMQLEVANHGKCKYNQTQTNLGISKLRGEKHEI